ncbi:MAG: hypothetical protein ACRD6N_16400, partial [Pyrinomonadaceae bacterium]
VLVIAGGGCCVGRAASDTGDRVFTSAALLFACGCLIGGVATFFVLVIAGGGGCCVGRAASETGDRVFTSAVLLFACGCLVGVATFFVFVLAGVGCVVFDSGRNGFTLAVTALVAFGSLTGALVGVFITGPPASLGFCNERV